MIGRKEQNLQHWGPNPMMILAYPGEWTKTVNEDSIYRFLKLAGKTDFFYFWFSTFSSDVSSEILFPALHKFLEISSARICRTACLGLKSLLKKQNNSNKERNKQTKDKLKSMCEKPLLSYQINNGWKSSSAWIKRILNMLSFFLLTDLLPIWLQGQEWIV